MGRRPCCAKVGLNRGAWTAPEDKMLSEYIKIHGEGKWRDLPQRAGLKRCGKSCRLRWLNYLRPDIKRGNISVEEEELIIRLHKLLGNRWSLIAGRLPGRTDNEIKNYWNTNLSKRMQDQESQISDQQLNKLKEKESAGNIVQPHTVIQTKAVRVNKVIIPQQYLDNEMANKINEVDQQNDSSIFMDFDIGDLLISDVFNPENHQGKETTYAISDHHNGEISRESGGMNMLCDFDFPYEAMLNNSSTEETILENWRTSDPLHEGNETLELKKLASFLNSEDEWID